MHCNTNHKCDNYSVTEAQVSCLASCYGLVFAVYPKCDKVITQKFSGEIAVLCIVLQLQQPYF